MTVVHGPSTVHPQEQSGKPAIPQDTLLHSSGRPFISGRLGKTGAACAGALLAPPTADVTAAVTELRLLGGRFKTSSGEGEQNGTSLPR